MTTKQILDLHDCTRIRIQQVQGKEEWKVTLSSKDKYKSFTVEGETMNEVYEKIAERGKLSDNRHKAIQSKRGNANVSTGTS